MSPIMPHTNALTFALNQPANSNMPMAERRQQNGDVNLCSSQDLNSLKPKWAERNIRLDPFKLPQNVSHGAVKHHGMDQSKFALTLGHDGATLYNVNAHGKTVEYMIPTKSFKGITACAYENQDGSTTITLELMHENEALSIPLLSSSTMDDVAADWHAWSRALRLPMLLKESDGNLIEVKNNETSLANTTAQPRRRRSFAINHRPKFAQHRKMGVQTSPQTNTISAITPLSAHDIITRDAVK